MAIDKTKKDHEKRIRPSWDETFMFSALWAACRSSCAHFQTGTVIVKDKRVIASGYNGAPPGIKNCLEKVCRKDREGVSFDVIGTGSCRGIHAEVNAMSQIARNDLKDTSMYSLYYPCSGCAKEIVGNGITEVVYCKIYREPDSLTKELFNEANVTIRRLDLNIEKYFEMIQRIYVPR
jgi:dCMP deaminase